jgi:tellurium resistance protein TerD
MAISLTKGGNVSLTKEAPGITKTTVGLGWNPRVTDGQLLTLMQLHF